MFSTHFSLLSQTRRDPWLCIFLFSFQDFFKFILLWNTFCCFACYRRHAETQQSAVFVFSFQDFSNSYGCETLFVFCLLSQTRRDQRSALRLLNWKCYWHLLLKCINCSEVGPFSICLAFPICLLARGQLEVLKLTKKEVINST